MRKLLLFSLAMAFAAGIAVVSLNSVSEAASAPNGSYKKSCKDIKVSSAGISAVCKTSSGTWKKTSLSSHGFPCGDIENDNGELICVSPSR